MLPPKYRKYLSADEDGSVDSSFLESAPSGIDDLLDNDGDEWTFFRMKRKVGGKVVNLRAYFPSGIHKYMDHSNDSSMGELAARFFKGRWKSWFNSVVVPALNEKSAMINRVIDIKLSEEYKKIEREYRSFGTVFRKKYAVNRYVEDDETGRIMRRRFRGLPIKEMTTKEKSRYRSSLRESWVSHIGGESAIKRIAKKEGDLFATLTINPYFYGLFVGNAFRKAASVIKRMVSSAIIGAKAPDIKDKTKQNRYRRLNPGRHRFVSEAHWSYDVNGHHVSYTNRDGKNIEYDMPAHHVEYTRRFDDVDTSWMSVGPPLNETGMLANSVKVEIV